MDLYNLVQRNTENAINEFATKATQYFDPCISNLNDAIDSIYSAARYVYITSKQKFLNNSDISNYFTKIDREFWFKTFS